MKKHFLLLTCFTSFIFAGKAQVIEGTDGYVEYHEGDLPIVISVPHGGYDMPANIPDRQCMDPVYAQDAFTLELAQRIDSSFFEMTGCRPHIVYCNLHRRKLDCNRNVAAGACGNSSAETAWNEFHSFIETAQGNAAEAHGNSTYFLDLHGHGNSIQRIELGYLLYDDELDLPDEELNTAQFIGWSSIQNLVAANAGGATHAALLRGEYALGTLLGNRGYPSVPSQQIQAPGTSTNYFSGGYITASHTSYAPDNEVNGVQVECNFIGVRDSHAHRKAFADSLVVVMSEYMGVHYEISDLNCNALGTVQSISEPPLNVFPNPFAENDRARIEMATCPDSRYEVMDTSGRIAAAGNLKSGGEAEMPAGLRAGVYIVRVFCKNGVQSLKVIKV